jgi:cupin superfamily acireductone dioxygenase involved in methionine salvage
MGDNSIRFLHVRDAQKEWIKTYGENAAYSEKKLLTGEDTPLISVSRRKVTVSGDLEADGYHAHSHTSTEVLFCIKGKLKGWIDGEGEIEINEGDLLMLAPNIKHAAQVCSEEIHAISIMIPAI